MNQPRKPLVIEIRISRASVRRAAIFVSTTLVIGAAALSYAATVPIPGSFIADKPLTAKQLNDNFDAVEARLKAVETFEAKATANGKYSLGATYCGATASAFTGNLGGLAGAKANCVTACSSSPTAHMCLPDELARSRALGTTIANGWYTTSVMSSASTLTADDCNGWSEASGRGGPRWNAADGQPSMVACTTSMPILCCD
jgi:hypothetical protein